MSRGLPHRRGCRRCRAARPVGEEEAPKASDPQRKAPRIVAGVGAAVILLVSAGTVRASTDPPLANFRQIDQGSAGGTVSSGRMPNPFVPSDTRDTDVYLPPDYSPSTHYPVLYLLHGFWGAPSSFVISLRLADIADSLIRAGTARPFIAVMPPGGLPVGSKHDRAASESAGAWEDFVVRTLVPWADTHLPTRRVAAEHAIAGVSAGSFGAVDIALRHLGVFATAESWEGYFHPFPDGPSSTHRVRRSRRTPSLLARRQAAAIRSHRVRFFSRRAAATAR